MKAFISILKTIMLIWNLVKYKEYNDISKFSWYQSSYSILWGKMICARRRLDYTKISCCYLIKIQPNRNQKPVWMKILSNIRFNSLWSSRHVYLLHSKLYSYKILTLGMTLYLLYHYTIIVFHVNMQVVPWNMVNAFYKLLFKIWWNG